MGLRLPKMVAGFAIVEVAIATGSSCTRCEGTISCTDGAAGFIFGADFGDLVAVVASLIAVDDAIAAGL